MVSYSEVTLCRCRFGWCAAIPDEGEETVKNIKITKDSFQAKKDSFRNSKVNIMNPVYSPAPTGVPYANPKGIGYPAGFPVGYAAAAAPAYSPSMYPGANTAFPTSYTPGTPYKMSCSPSTGAVPPYSSSPSPYPAAVYPVRSSYPQQNPYAQQGTYYTQPLYAAPPHVIHHTTVVQPNGMPAAMDYHGNVSWDFVDDPLSDSSRPSPSNDAHIQTTWRTSLQLCASAMVNNWQC
ncbi:hypothetical protein AGOR_G00143730 [Albula goreensis]|uniref:Uncharacterized protein n=1 Tax=Albula goreensis TaxID=1534307 RepID=A0A8T3D1B6_9TELE|nr:hypothetical protein AGOR_G00143730 [Albula goreensis]